MKNIIWFEDLRLTDIDQVGGKNASLGEMISQLTTKGINVPGGFATTSYAFRMFIEHNNLKSKIDDLLQNLEASDIILLSKTSKLIQSWILEGSFQSDLENDIEVAYQKLLDIYGSDITVAVRSSATSEDLPDASFAGQQDTHLNIYGIEEVKLAIKHVFASLYNDRAISYRVHKGFSNTSIYLSAGVQKMVRSDIGSSGVVFTIDTESGFDKVILITSSYGLGECIVQGMVNPDEFYVFKPSLKINKPSIIRKNIGNKNIKMIFNTSSKINNSVKTVNLTDEQKLSFSLNEDKIYELANFALIIEEHYKIPMDIEWGLDGKDNKIYILQARPETIVSKENSSKKQIKYSIKKNNEVLVSGRAVGQKAASGKVRIIHDIKDMYKIEKGDVLVTDITDPNWETVMKIASAIVTNRGGRTCHAAIIARELGVPAVVGCENATEILKDNMLVTVSCCEGDVGYIYNGLLPIEIQQLDTGQMPEIPVKLMMNIGNPKLAFSFSKIPNFGVGLARIEFIINKQIGIHPSALLNYDNIPVQLKHIIKEKISGYSNPVSFYVEKLVEGIATIAASFYPNKVIVRFSDFKSNEYSNLIGGKLYEPIEENPMMGFRGASRYSSTNFRECFKLECMAIKKVIYHMGLDNVAVMVPFVRTVEEAHQVIELLKEYGLERKNGGLQIYMMCEVPSNAILAEKFLQYFDGFSIGSNDLTQLTLGIDRDANGVISSSFDERNDAVKFLLELAIKACLKNNKYIGICGQGPSDHIDLAEWLINKGIETISLNPDTIIDTWLHLSKIYNSNK